MKKLFITNTLSGKKESFQPRHENKVSMYVCGITPYDYAHMGHGRCYVTFDFLYRFLRFLGYEVSYCRNFTDIDDKLLAKAELEFQDPFRYSEIAERYSKAFHEDMQALRCLPPDYEPRVTQTIPEIIAFIEGLIKEGKAYEAGGDVYFDIASFPAYGKLSKRNLDDLLMGARVEVNELKKSPYDFALWKAEPENTFWKSPWGYGRPGWHIECSAMARMYLGDQLDMHGGGMDLIFPHHENEIAQSEGLLNKQFVNYWLHIAFVTMNKEKMSKSLGNFFTLRDVFKKYDPMVVRYYFLTHYFRAPLDFSFDDLDSAHKTYQRLCRMFEDHACPGCKNNSSDYIQSSTIVQDMVDTLLDDLNMSGMFGILYDAAALIKSNEDERCKVKMFLQQIFGFALVPLAEKKVEMTPQIEHLIHQRDHARAAKDWATADRIRNELEALGYQVQDVKSKEKK